MIIYNPLDGYPIPNPIANQPKHCFLMTRIGDPIPPMVEEMRKEITSACAPLNYTVIDAQTKVTGRDFLLKIWKLIAATPLSIGIMHEDIPLSTQANIFYELGVAQALGKETVIIKSPDSSIPSDFSRSEYVKFDKGFRTNFTAYMKSIFEQADSYELMADQLEKNPLLAIDYYRRSFLITGDKRLKEKAQRVVNGAGLEERAKNSVELMTAFFISESCP